jgi:hypothetical protein
MSKRISVLPAAALFALAIGVLGSSQADPPQVEAQGLEKRRDLIGREIIVDDHVTYYVPRNGTAADELQLKRTGVTFLVPRQLRPAAGTRLTSVQLRGTLRLEGDRLVFDVTALKSLPADLERLEQGLAGLPAGDFETRKSWARWAKDRAREFKDAPLAKRAQRLESEALAIEADFKRQAVDAPEEWLALARDARKRGVAEPEPSALAHRALAVRLASATEPAALRALLEEIEFFFPDAAGDRQSARVDLARTIAAYRDDPAGVYRSASGDTRKALDRRLWADATERLIVAESNADLESTLSQAMKAESRLPEKPGLPARLMEAAAGKIRQNLGAARLAEIKELARIYKEKLQRPDDARALLRDWLKIQTDRLSKTDAEGPLALALLYEELLSDRVTAVELLRKGWQIDPSSPEIAEAFRSRGFHKEKNDWIEAPPTTSAPPVADSPAGVRPGQAPGAKGLKGLTPDDVRAQIGSRPDRVNFVGSRSQLIEQWIYVLDSKYVRYINFLHTPGEYKPRVIAEYQVPRILTKGVNAPAH